MNNNEFKVANATKTSLSKLNKVCTTLAFPKDLKEVLSLLRKVSDRYMHTSVITPEELKDKMLECSEFDGWYIYDLDEKGICDKIQELEEFYDECKNILLCLMAVATGEHQQGEQSFVNVVEEYMNDLSKIEN